jgi:hypothetical protein
MAALQTQVSLLSQLLLAPTPTVPPAMAMVLSMVGWLVNLLRTPETRVATLAEGPSFRFLGTVTSA